MKAILDFDFDVHIGGTFLKRIEFLLNTLSLCAILPDI